MPSRRKAIKSLVSVPFIGALLSPEKLTASSSVVNNLTTNFSRDFFKELGVRTFINAAGTYTSMTGSLMPKEVIEAKKVWNFNVKIVKNNRTLDNSGGVTLLINEVRKNK